MQSYAFCEVDSGETACIVHLHKNVLHAHAIMFIEEFGAFIALSSLLPCSGALMNLNAVQYLACLSVVFVTTTLSLSTLGQQLFYCFRQLKLDAIL